METSNNTNTELADTIRKQFRRCDEATIQAIVRFRATGEREQIQPIVLGIVARYLSTVDREVLHHATPETPLSDLHIESLTMLEIILDIQDALEIVVEDAELRKFVTLGDVYHFLDQKVAEKEQGGSSPAA